MHNYIGELLNKPGVPDHIISELEKIIQSSRIVVFSKSYCPYCVLTKHLLRKLKQEYTLIELDWVHEGFLKQRGLLKLTGQSTVPNIFINGNHIGGNDKLQALRSSGELEKLLQSKGEQSESVQKQGS